MHSAFSPIRWESNRLELIDQRVLPDQELWLAFDSAQETAQAITHMVVRGAPAIGIAAAYGVALSCLRVSEQNRENWKYSIATDIELLAQSRPTAVNLFWALTRMQKAIKNAESSSQAFTIAIKEAQAIHQEDYQMNLEIGEYGSSLLPESANVLTHCNTGALATGGHGTALGVIRSAWQTRKLQHVYANETRPWLQGSRLTIWELLRENIPCTLQADSAAALLMKTKKIDWVIVGADRISANGDTANKIGTYSLALLAKAHGVKFMVAAPTTTIDMSLVSGESIPIEEREAGELWRAASQAEIPENLNFHNPVFDVTPAHLIDAIVTEKGIAKSNNNAEFNKAFSAWFSR